MVGVMFTQREKQSLASDTLPSRSSCRPLWRLTSLRLKDAWMKPNGTQSEILNQILKQNENYRKIICSKTKLCLHINLQKHSCLEIMMLWHHCVGAKTKVDQTQTQPSFLVKDNDKVLDVFLSVTLSIYWWRGCLVLPVNRSVHSFLHLHT